MLKRGGHRNDLEDGTGGVEALDRAVQEWQAGVGQEGCHSLTGFECGGIVTRPRREGTDGPRWQINDHNAAGSDTQGILGDGLEVQVDAGGDHSAVPRRCGGEGGCDLAIWFEDIEAAAPRPGEVGFGEAFQARPANPVTGDEAFGCKGHQFLGRCLGGVSDQRSGSLACGIDTCANPGRGCLGRRRGCEGRGTWRDGRGCYRECGCRWREACHRAAIAIDDASANRRV